MVGSLTCLRNSLRSFFFCSSWRAYRKLNFQNSTFHTFIFFSVWELTEFNKSCNLIGSGSGWNFPIRPALGRWNQHLLKSVSSLSGNLCSYISKNLTVLYVYVLQYQLQVTKQLGGQSDKQKVWLKTLNNYFLSWSRFLNQSRVKLHMSEVKQYHLLTLALLFFFFSAVGKTSGLAWSNNFSRQLSIFLPRLFFLHCWQN